MSFDNFDSFDWNAMQNNAIEKTKKSFEKDTRYWNISSNEQGIGSAVIRLLPDPKNRPYVQRFEYSLKKPIPGAKAKWYIANSRETIKEPDPAKEYFDKLKAEGTKEAEELAKTFSRGTKYICNILVVNDPVNPENNNKVFLFKMGTKLKSKIDGWMKPDANEISCGVEPKQFFNPLGEGRDILLKVRPLGNIPNYDDTEYKDKRPLFNDKETAINWIITNAYDLEENVLHEREYEPYDVLKKRFDSYLGAGSPQAAQPMPVQPVQPVGIQPTVENAVYTQPAYIQPGVQVAQVAQPVQPAGIQPAYVQPEYVQPQVAQVAQTTQPIQQVQPQVAQVAQPAYIQPGIQAAQVAPTAVAVQPGVASDDWMNEIE